MSDIKNQILANYHTHIYLCRHATGTILDYVEKAVSLNYQTIGISDHGPFPEWLRVELHSKRMREDELINTYLKDLQTITEGFKNKIKVLKGLEIEYLPEIIDLIPKYRSLVDYLILGQHYYKVNGKFKNVYSKTKSSDLYVYANSISEALDTGYFKILAHPEVIMFNYPIWDEHCESAMRIIIEAAIRNNVYLEFNANGIRRETLIPYEGYQYQEMYRYPRFEFWDLLYSEYNYDKVIINDDCHAVNDFHDDATIKAYEYFKEHNYPFKMIIEELEN